MIYTSYFAKLSKIPKEMVPVSICAKAPPWFQGLEYKKLAPSYSILMKYTQDKNEEDYVKAFESEILAKLNPYQVVVELKRMADGRDIALLCYEKPSDFCHRHLVADWLTKTGFECNELTL